MSTTLKEVLDSFVEANPPTATLVIGGETVYLLTPEQLLAFAEAVKGAYIDALLTPA
jgi:hypothetical protein